MSYYFLSLGSNINPRRNVIRMLDRLLRLSPAVEISRVVETAPVGMPSGSAPFLNLVARIQSDLDAYELKQKLNEIEISLGRDRDDPRSKVLDRPADIDILFFLPSGLSPVPSSRLPSEPYVRPLLLELLHWLGHSPQGPDKLAPGVILNWRGRHVGDHPQSLLRAAAVS